MFGGILGSMIVTQHPRDLKTSFLRFSRDFQHRFEISTLRFSSKFSVFEILGLLGHFFGRYLSPGCRDVTGKPGFVVFRSSRYFSLKKSSKNIKFSESYRSRHFPGEKSAKSSTESSSNLFCDLFHVRFLDFDQKFEKFTKFYRKAMFFILKHFLKRENERHELEPRKVTFRGSAGPTFSRPSLRT